MNALSSLPAAGFRGSRPLLVALLGVVTYLIVRLIPLGPPWGTVIRFGLVVLVALVIIRALVAEWTWDFLPARAPVGWLLAFGLGFLGVLVATGLPLLLSGGSFDPEASHRLAEGIGLGADPAVNQAIVIGWVIAAPIAGELVFRGMVFAGLRNGLDQWLETTPAVVTAAVVSAIAFTLVTRPGPALLMLGFGLAALVWAFGYHLTGSLLVGVGSLGAANAWLLWTLLHGSNAVAAGDGSTMAMIVVGPLAAIGVARLLGRMIAVGTATSG